jgi:hypothetical protein
MDLLAESHGKTLADATMPTELINFRIFGQPETRVVGDEITLAFIDRVACVIEEPRTNPS